MDRLLGRHAVLVEFWDFARINSLRTLPYLKAWHERYSRHGLQVIGVHSPGYSFGRDRDVVARAVDRLAVPYPVALDPELVVWREYGNRGWPGRYLFDRRSRLTLLHYGEGEYEETERAIQDALPGARPEPGPAAAARSAAARGRSGRAARAADGGRGAPGRAATGSSWCATGSRGTTGSRRPTPAPRRRWSSRRARAWAVLSGARRRARRPRDRRHGDRRVARACASTASSSRRNHRTDGCVSPLPAPPAAA